MTIAPVSPERLTVVCDADHMESLANDGAAAGDRVIGQSRAMEAISFGAEIERPGYNLFVMGPEGTGKEAAVLDFLRQRAAGERPPWDWVYVNDFIRQHQPNAIRLPSGRGRLLAEAMDHFIDDVREAIPALLNNEENQNRLRAIDEEFRHRPEEAFEALGARAAERNVALVRSPMGFGLAPMADGEVIKPEAFGDLSDQQKKRFESDIEELQKELQDLIKQVPRWEQARRAAIRDLQQEITATGISASLDSVIALFKDLPDILDHLEAVRRDLIENFHSIRASEQMAGQVPQPGGQGAVYEADGYDRYKVNAFICHDDGPGAPVVVEDNPSALNLIGRAEHTAHYGAMVTDFSLIKPGALHRANGGYLVLDARKVLSQPFAWEALKRALKAQEIVIEAPGQMFSLIATVSLEPEPIPLTAKIVLVGERLLFYLLSDLDPEFPDLFKVVADFETEMARNAESEKTFLGMVNRRIEDAGLLAFGGDALGELIRRSVRLAGDSAKVSIHMRGLSDLLCESDFLARQDGAARVAGQHVRQAIECQEHRLDRMRERELEAIEREIIFIATEGEAVGQVNGLSVLQLGGYAFGRPSRITARVRLGSGKVIDIEREVKLGGALHSKGVMILSGFLAGRYATNEPLSLSATLVFEQSYGGVDGDSASSAELYALLSALSNVPLRQDLAVTGSVNQMGQVQAIGGVNEKIECFFDLCKRRGLSGSQGVVIPRANLDHLVLRDEVVEAARAGSFQIYAVATIDEGIALLTGRAAGECDAEGAYPEGSINALVEARLRAFSSARRDFGRDEPSSKDAPS